MPYHGRACANRHVCPTRAPVRTVSSPLLFPRELAREGLITASAIAAVLSLLAATTLALHPWGALGLAAAALCVALLATPLAGLPRGWPRPLARALLTGLAALASAGVLAYGALFLDRGEPHLVLCALSTLACATFSRAHRRLAADPARGARAPLPG